MLHGENLSFVAADLTSDNGWADAVSAVDFVLHVASPVQPGHVQNEDDLIVPAREGALRAARDANVKRVVLTSAFHAVSWGHPHDGHTFTESDWTERISHSDEGDRRHYQGASRRCGQARPERIGAMFSAKFRPIVHDLDYAKKISTEKARRVLGWRARNSEEAILAAAESMVKKGLIKK
jgi:nucleoside-diphosphate-sugar epimerase